MAHPLHKAPARARAGTAVLCDRVMMRTCYGVLTVAAFGFVGALVLGLVS